MSTGVGPGFACRGVSWPGCARATSSPRACRPFVTETASMTGGALAPVGGIAEAADGVADSGIALAPAAEMVVKPRRKMAAETAPPAQGAANQGESLPPTPPRRRLYPPPTSRKKPARVQAELAEAPKSRGLQGSQQLSRALELYAVRDPSGTAVRPAIRRGEARHRVRPGWLVSPARGRGSGGMGGDQISPHRRRFGGRRRPGPERAAAAGKLRAGAAPRSTGRWCAGPCPGQARGLEPGGDPLSGDGLGQGAGPAAVGDHELIAGKAGAGRLSPPCIEDPRHRCATRARDPGFPGRAGVLFPCYHCENNNDVRKGGTDATTGKPQSLIGKQGNENMDLLCGLLCRRRTLLSCCGCFFFTQWSGHQ